MEELERMYLQNLDSSYKSLATIGIQSKDKDGNVGSFNGIVLNITDIFEPLDLTEKENQMLLYSICENVVGIRKRNDLYALILRLINKRKEWKTRIEEMQWLDENRGQ